MSLDATGRTAGRGAYVCRDAACIAGATGRGLLSRALVSPIPAALATELAAELAAAMTTSTITSTPGGLVGQE